MRQGMTRLQVRRLYSINVRRCVDTKMMGLGEQYDDTH